MHVVSPALKQLRDDFGGKVSRSTCHADDGQARRVPGTRVHAAGSLRVFPHHPSLRPPASLPSPPTYVGRQQPETPESEHLKPMIDNVTCACLTGRGCGQVLASTDSIGAVATRSRHCSVHQQTSSVHLMKTVKFKVSARWVVYYTIRGEI